jgi:hypothetical protein
LNYCGLYISLLMAITQLILFFLKWLISISFACIWS